MTRKVDLTRKKKAYLWGGQKKDDTRVWEEKNGLEFQGKKPAQPPPPPQKKKKKKTPKREGVSSEKVSKTTPDVRLS